MKTGTTRKAVAAILALIGLLAFTTAAFSTAGGSSLSDADKASLEVARTASQASLSNCRDILNRNPGKTIRSEANECVANVTNVIARINGVLTAGTTTTLPTTTLPATTTTRPATTTTATTNTTQPVTTTTTVQSPPGVAPSSPPIIACGNRTLLDGPSTPPPGAVIVPAGNNSTQIGETWLVQANTTYWFAPGVHTLQASIYGQIAPKNNTSWIGAPGAILDGQNINHTAFGGHATDVTIRNLEIRNFDGNRDEGVVNHDFGARWNITRNYVHGNEGAAVFGGTDNVVSYNCIDRNGQYGFQGGGTNVTFDHNEISNNNTADWEAQIPGCGCTGGGKFWDVNTAIVTNNYVHDNLSVGIWADTNNRNFLIEGNYISNNWGEGILYETSYNARIAANTFIRNGLGKGPTNPGFPTGAIYLSESGGDSRISGGRFASFEIANNVFTDNWSGVILWENADRFCGSPANTSTAYCTLLVNNGVAAPSVCNSSNIASQPYYDDCRWKTMNVLVHHNAFNLTPSNLTNCSASTGCGYNGVFANFGTYPSWSPYQGGIVPDAIAFKQNNKFQSNTYKGPWSFIPRQLGYPVNYATWRAAPYGQDAGSTVSP